MCDFHLSLLDFIFTKKTLIDFWWFLEKDFIFEIWSLELETWNFETWDFEILKICDLKFWTWNLKFDIFATWNFETGDLKIHNLKSGDFKIWDMRFETWNFETWDFGILR